MFCGLWVENSVKACLLTYLYDFRVRLQGYSNFSKSVPTHVLHVQYVGHINAPESEITVS